MATTQLSPKGVTEPAGKAVPEPVPWRKVKKHGAVTSWLFAAPALIVYVWFLISPALQSLFFSFTDWDGLSATYNITGFKNYLSMFSDAIVQTAVKNNLIWTVVTITVPVALGLGLAILLNSHAYAKPLLRLLFYTPSVLPLVSIASIWGWLYNPQYGAINEALRAVGLGSLARSWLGLDSTALAAVMVPAIWLRAGFPMLIYLAGLQSIPKELYEAATMDRANRLQQLVHVTLPSLKQTHLIVLALSLIDSFKVFDMIYAMTYGGPGTSTQVFGTYMYANVFQYYKAGYGMALAVVITLVAIAVSIPYVLSQTREDRR